MDEQNVNPGALQETLANVEFPATKQDIISQVQDNQADPQVMDFLEKIPDQDYATPEEVTGQLGGENDLSDGDMLADDELI